MKKKKRKAPVGYSVFGFPAQIVSGGVNISIYENIGAVIDNYGCICEYRENRLRVKTRIGCIAVSGEDLRICASESGTLSLTGIIHSVAFEYSNCGE